MNSLLLPRAHYARCTFGARGLNNWNLKGKKWSGRPGSNRRRPAWEAGILPLNYTRSRSIITKARRARQAHLIAMRAWSRVDCVLELCIKENFCHG